MRCSNLDPFSRTARSQSFGTLNIYFKSHSGDVFTSKNLASIEKMERKIMHAKDYDQYCQLHETHEGVPACYFPKSVNVVLNKIRQQPEICVCASEWEHVSCAALNTTFSYYSQGTPLDVANQTVSGIYVV